MTSFSGRKKPYFYNKVLIAHIHAVGFGLGMLILTGGKENCFDVLVAVFGLLSASEKILPG